MTKALYPLLVWIFTYFGAIHTETSFAHSENAFHMLLKAIAGGELPYSEKVFDVLMRTIADGEPERGYCPRRKIDTITYQYPYRYTDNGSTFSWICLYSLSSRTDKVNLVFFITPRGSRAAGS